MKISPTMQKALDALPLRYQTWGTTNFSNDFPKGVTLATIHGLQRRGLVIIERDGPFDRKVVKKEPAK